MDLTERKQKIIRNINSLLQKLSEKQLRLLLMIAWMFDKVPQEKVYHTKER